MSRRGSSGSEPEENPLARIPTRNVEESLPPAAQIRDARYIASSADPPAPLAHQYEMERLKEEHKQKMDLARETYRQQVETRSWCATVCVIALLLVTFGLLALLVPNLEIKKLAIGGLSTVAALWIGYVAGQAKAKGSGGD